MRRRLFLSLAIAALALSVIVVAGCGKKTTVKSTPSTPKSTSPTAGAASVRIVDFAFNPTDMVRAVGLNAKSTMRTLAAPAVGEVDLGVLGVLFTVVFFPQPATTMTDNASAAIARLKNNLLLIVAPFFAVDLAADISQAGARRVPPPTSTCAN